ncbi:acyltransferase family protein [Cohnella fermenti]|uniref:Acyltransferase n=1 Tax=Cohnella fermenti TaxID=2565925 RepID=A0A4V3WFL9_9BACL|nr:acyltransferase [Cohnella fermenti]THF80832.1 acyltransferase [Cohnella fermenti]
MESGRILQLDSLRGIAALTVVFGHIAQVVDTPLSVALLGGISPLRVFVNGMPAVILFFVLSGFVLTLPYLNGKNNTFLVFYLKRILRIYIPYIIAMFFAFVLCNMLSTQGIDSVSSWFNKSWNEPITANLIVEHVILIGDPHTNAVNSVIWSLVHEMRISLIFPFLVFLVIRLNWRYIIGLCIILSFSGILNSIFEWHLGNGNNTSYFDSLHYSSMFLLGSLIAKHASQLKIMYAEVQNKYKWMLVVIALLLYNYSGIFNKVLKTFDLHFGHMIGDYMIAVAAGFFMILAICSPNFASLLLLKPIVFLGRISYSLYLYHWIVLYSLIYLFHDNLPIWIIYILVLLVSIVVSAIAYKYIEVPLINLGKRFTNRYVQSSNTFGVTR